MVPDHLVHTFDELEADMELGNFGVVICALQLMPLESWKCVEFYVAHARCSAWLGKLEEAHDILKTADRLIEEGLVE